MLGFRCFLIAALFLASLSAKAEIRIAHLQDGKASIEYLISQKSNTTSSFRITPQRSASESSILLADWFVSVDGGPVQTILGRPAQSRLEGSRAVLLWRLEGELDFELLLSLKEGPAPLGVSF